MKSGRQIMNLLRDYEPCGSLRSTGELNGCSPNTVKLYAKLRVEGGLGDRDRLERASVIDPYRAKCHPSGSLPHPKSGSESRAEQPF